MCRFELVCKGATQSIQLHIHGSAYSMPFLFSFLEREMFVHFCVQSCIYILQQGRSSVGVKLGCGPPRIFMFCFLPMQFWSPAHFQSSNQGMIDPILLSCSCVAAHLLPVTRTVPMFLPHNEAPAGRPLHHTGSTG